MSQPRQSLPPRDATGSEPSTGRRPFGCPHRGPPGTPTGKYEMDILLPTQNNGHDYSYTHELISTTVWSNCQRNQGTSRLIRRVNNSKTCVIARDDKVGMVISLELQWCYFDVLHVVRSVDYRQNRQYALQYWLFNPFPELIMACVVNTMHMHDHCW